MGTAAQANKRDIVNLNITYRFKRFNLTLGCMTLCTFWLQAFTLAEAFASTSLAEEQIRKS
jgi:hypothetical protein